MIDLLPQWFQPIVISAWPWLWMFLKIALFTIVPLTIAVAMYTYAERKVIGFIQDRQGPNRVGPLGLLQPFADVIKLVFKEVITPTVSSKLVFVIAPLLALVPAFAAWAVIPFGPSESMRAWSNIDAGLLYILAMTSLGVYGIILAGWASNSKYAFLGAMRSAAQIISYELAMGFALVGVLIGSGSMNMAKIINAQGGDMGLFEWFWLPLLPLFVIYVISGVAETNRAPFDVSEGESEIVAGFHVEYSGTGFSVFFLAEYANMLLISFLAAILFLGGWHSPFPTAWLGDNFLTAPSSFWLFAKVFLFAFSFLWFRATFPRYRYDQIMRLGWKIFIPITLVWIIVAALLFVSGAVTRGS